MAASGFTFQVGISPDWADWARYTLQTALTEVLEPLPGLSHEVMPESGGLITREILDRYDAVIAFAYPFLGEAVRGLKPQPGWTMRPREPGAGRESRECKIQRCAAPRAASGLSDGGFDYGDECRKLDSLSKQSGERLRGRCRAEEGAGRAPRGSRGLGPRESMTLTPFESRAARG